MERCDKRAAQRHVVFHVPGPQWQPGVDFRQQSSALAHVLHYRQLLEQGRLEIGGPFLQTDAGGMMIAVPQVSFEEIDAYAAADPAVQAELLCYEIRAWYTPMTRDK